jgi:hypothetical protein
MHAGHRVTVRPSADHLPQGAQMSVHEENSLGRVGCSRGKNSSPDTRRVLAAIIPASTTVPVSNSKNVFAVPSQMSPKDASYAISIQLQSTLVRASVRASGLCWLSKLSLASSIKR